MRGHPTRRSPEGLKADEKGKNLTWAPFDFGVLGTASRGPLQVLVTGQLQSSLSKACFAAKRCAGVM
ncbi:hypothetical protein L598_000200000480 [Mesorhizobium sp. J18]|nr:hypothetical protein L598_000200000480 [Mesorhizobium sp. J18]